MKQTVCIFILSLTAIISYGQETESMRTFDPTFVHNVYFWLHRPDSPEDRKQFEAALTKFLGKSAYAKTKFIGTPPKASREVVDGSFTYSLVLSFDSAEAQDAYQNEEPHHEFIAEASHLWKKVIVYDSKGLPE